MIGFVCISIPCVVCLLYLYELNLLLSEVLAEVKEAAFAAPRSLLVAASGSPLARQIKEDARSGMSTMAGW